MKPPLKSPILKQTKQFSLHIANLDFQGLLATDIAVLIRLSITILIDIRDKKK